MGFLAKMLSMLTGAYNKADEYNVRNQIQPETNLGKLFAVVDWGFSLIESSAERVRLWTDIDFAQGKTLNRHGANFGVSRGGADDVFYRLLIKIKILSQISGGDIETILSAVSGLYGIDATRIELYELSPAKVQIAIFEDDLPDSYMDVKDLVGHLTKRLLSAGISLDMVYKGEDATNSKLYLGGRPVSEFTRIRLTNRVEELSDIKGSIRLGGIMASEFTRVKLKNQVL